MAGLQKTASSGSGIARQAQTYIVALCCLLSVGAWVNHEMAPYGKDMPTGQYQRMDLNNANVMSEGKQVKVYGKTMDNRDYSRTFDADQNVNLSKDTINNGHLTFFIYQVPQDVLQTRFPFVFDDFTDKISVNQADADAAGMAMNNLLAQFGNTPRYKVHLTDSICAGIVYLVVGGIVGALITIPVDLYQSRRLTGKGK